MKQVYATGNLMEAGFVQSLLEQQGIEATVEGELLPEPTGVATTTIWVRDKDVALAESIIEEYKRREAGRADAPQGARATWTCPACGEKVEDQFTKASRTNNLYNLAVICSTVFHA